MRRRGPLVPETAKIATAQIVDEQDYHIGLPAEASLTLPEAGVQASSDCASQQRLWLQLLSS